jgi:hypothetical protein
MGGRIAVLIDGQELRGVLRAQLVLDHEHDLPVLKVSLGVLTSLSTDLPARVVLDKSTRKALAAMGWTPPGDTTPAPTAAGDDDD